MTFDPAEFETTATAYGVGILERHGNTLSGDHADALRGIAELAGRILAGALAGRFRVGLPCGMGKSTMVRATLKALAAKRSTALKESFKGSGPFPRIVVACSKVEQLCELKRTLLTEDGIPTELVGLVHSYEFNPERAKVADGYASEPSEGHDRPFLLVTHSNVQSAKERDWMQGAALVFFDESLIVGASQTLTLKTETRDCIVVELAGLKALAPSYPHLQDCAAWFDNLVGRLVAASEGHAGDEVRTVRLERPDTAVTASFKRLRLLATEQCPNLAKLIELAERAEELRVFTSQGGRSLISYRTSVPNELQNVVVLDASDPIRELVHYDARMQRIEDVLPSLARFKVSGLASIKRNDRVAFYVANDAGGREAMRSAFRDTGDAQPWAIEKLIRLVKSKPAESFLIFTYKDRDGAKFARTIIDAMEKAGIRYPEIGDDGRARLNVMTWGQETATNAYAHCQNVVLLGVIFQPEDSVASRYLGQVDDIRAPAVASAVRSLVLSECAHSIYQAANRGQGRQVDVVDGITQAKPMSVYLWHRDARIQQRLDPVTSGARWLPWREEGEDMDAHDVARLIVNKLDSFKAAGIHHCSLRRLKKALAPAIPATTWKRARGVAIDARPLWRLSGGSVELLPFRDESAEAA